MNTLKSILEQKICVAMEWTHVCFVFKMKTNICRVTSTKSQMSPPIYPL